MTGTIVKLHIDNGWNSSKDKGKKITTVQIHDRNGEPNQNNGEFTVEGELGPLGSKVNITATLAVA